jgi:hypothetical protein
MFILIMFLICLILICMSLLSITNTPIIQPILQALLQTMDKIPKTSNPKQSLGSIQENFGTIPVTTIYNAHGIVTPDSPNTLLARV